MGPLFRTQSCFFYWSPSLTEARREASLIGGEQRDEVDTAQPRLLSSPLGHPLPCVR